LLLGKFDPEDEGDILLRNVGLFSSEYTAFNPEDKMLHNLRCESLKSCRTKFDNAKVQAAYKEETVQSFETFLIEQ
jgi:hypothetical protein